MSRSASRTASPPSASGLLERLGSSSSLHRSGSASATSPTTKSPSNSPQRTRHESPSAMKFFSKDKEGSLVYQGAMTKIYDAAWRFDRTVPAGLSFINACETKSLAKETFRQMCRASLNLKLSNDEVDSVLHHFKSSDGESIDGVQFLMMLYQMRFDHSDRILVDRLEKERKNAAQRRSEFEGHQQLLESKATMKVVYRFTDEEKISGMVKLLEAAFKYDRLMPGAPQLGAFDCEFMRPEEFKNQLKSVFNLRLTQNEFAAVFLFLNKNEMLESIKCSQFLVYFLRQGFLERQKRYAENRTVQQKEKEDREKKRQHDLAILDTKNNLKCSLDFLADDKTSVLAKLDEAARLYDRNTPGAVSLEAFEVKTMEPHVFKEQLKRVFNLKVTPPELGALLTIFDEHKKGVIVCSTFTKDFLQRGFENRDKHLRESIAAQKEAEIIREKKFKEQLERLSNKNHIDLSGIKWNEDDMESAMEKLMDAAWRFDRQMPGAPNLQAFESRDMEPHIFKEQLRRAFNMQVSNEEMCALMKHFDPQNTGRVHCKDFINKFVKLGITERDNRSSEWRVRQRELIQDQERIAKEKKEEADGKVALSMDAFSDVDYESAMIKLTEAAVKYDKSAPGAPGLEAFDCETMPAHVFKEQMKNTFRTKLTMRETSALMSYFDKEKKGEIVCKDFLITFSRIGYEKRAKATSEYREQLKIKQAEKLKQEEARRKENMTRGLVEVNPDYSEADFDSALQKIIFISHHFDRRSVGPAGLNGFLCDSLSATEFREMIKRTFGVKLNGSELGALITYFDVKNKNVVDCQAFMSSYKGIKIHTADFKGKPDEDKLLQEYQQELKDVFKERVKRSATSEGDAKAKKPWQAGAAIVAAVSGSSSRPHKVKRPYPNTAADKVKVRFMVSKVTYKLDLSTRMTEVKAPKVPTAETDGNETDDSHITTVADSPLDQNKEIDTTKMLASKTFDARKDVIKLLNIKRGGVDFKLSTIPEDVWKNNTLRELYLCNNEIASVPPQLGDLGHLRVLSLSNNNLFRLPPELGLLIHLQRLYLDRNNLSTLPELIKELHNLTELNLAHNQFAVLPPALLTLCNIINLDLSNNQLSDLPYTFRNLRSLNFVDLTSNPIYLPPIVFEKMYWCNATGVPLPIGEKATYQFKITRHDEDEIEDMIKNRGRNVITSKLRRRKRK